MVAFVESARKAADPLEALQGSDTDEPSVDAMLELLALARQTEFDLLEQLMRAGDVVSTKEALSLKVLGRPREVYDRSVDVHISNLRKKLSAVSDGCVEVETIRGVGWRLRVRA